MSRSDILEQVAGLPPLLVNVIKAALQAQKEDACADRRGEAEFLAAAGRLASLNVAARGVLAPGPELWKPIEDLAGSHLDLADAKQEFRNALTRIEKFKRRDAIESAATRMLTASDTAYYYAGLAFGLTLADLSRHR